MQKKILIALFAVLLFGLIGILYNFFNYSDQEIVKDKEYLSPLDKKQKKQSLSKSWIESLVKNKNSNYQYPVNELFMHIDLQKYIPPKTKSYRLEIQNIDRYSLFCVMQTLQDFKIPFIISKQGKTQSIYMGSNNNKRLKEIGRKLMRYDISSKITEVWK